MIRIRREVKFVRENIHKQRGSKNHAKSFQLRGHSLIYNKSCELSPPNYRTVSTTLLVVLGMGPLTVIHAKNTIPVYSIESNIECGDSLPYQDPIKIFDST